MSMKSCVFISFHLKSLALTISDFKDVFVIQFPHGVDPYLIFHVIIPHIVSSGVVPVP